MTEHASTEDAAGLSAIPIATIFQDETSRNLLNHIARVAPSQAPVLLLGETGTGKELVARHIHQVSNRASGPFVSFNCGAFSEPLVDGELFGCERGALPGVFEPQAGWFEAAHGGTLFLDEVDELPLVTQGKLLRALLDSRVLRVGGRAMQPVDVRLITALRRPLEQVASNDSFRRDLLFRLNVVALDILPLRQRPGDILPLCQYFLDRYCRRLGHASVTLTPHAEQKLLQYDWPGNLWELENVPHHALLVGRQGIIDSEDLYFSSIQGMEQGDHAGETAQALLEKALLRVFEESPGNVHELVEDTLLRAAYRFCRFNQVHTSDLLGLSRHITRSRLIKQGELVVNKRG